MKVVGITSQQEVFVGSKERNFRINEFLIIEDLVQGDLLGEVVEAQTFNRYIPLTRSGDFVDDSVLESLNALGYNIDEETIYIARIRLLNEALYPVETGSNLRVPLFEEIKDLMVKSKLEESLVLGVIRNTEDMAQGMDEELKNVLTTFEDGEILPQKEIPYLLHLDSMHQYPHIGVFGGSGSGKSFGLRVVLEEIMKQEIPTVVLDPHFEMDFSEIAPYFSQKELSYENKFSCFQVGNHIGVKFEDLSAQDLKNLLNAVSNLTDSMDNVIDILLKRGDSIYSFTDRMRKLLEAQELGSLEKIQAEIDGSTGDERDSWEKTMEIYENYDKLCPHNSVRGIVWRLRSLENQGIFSKDIRPVEEGLLNGKLVVIQGNTKILQVFSTYLLNNIYHKRREYKDGLYANISQEYFPPFMVVTDEAHNFAPKGYDSPSKSILKEISQEGRKYGTFLILASQRPTLLDDTITAQLNTKFIFRTVRASDIDTIQEETDLTREETRRLPYLRTGDVFISSAVMGRTVYGRIRAADTVTPHTENPFEELRKRKKDNIDEFLNIVKNKLPVNGADLLGFTQEVNSEYGLNYTIETIKIQLDNLVDKGLILGEDTPFGTSYKNK